MKKNTRLVGGAILSYILIAFNAIYGMVITPFIISRLGVEEYGVYKTIAALSSTLMVLDLGIGGTISRYIASYNAKKENDKIPNFLAIMLFEVVLISVFMMVVLTIFYNMIDKIYQNSFTVEQIKLAKMLFFLLSINMIIHLFENFFSGIIMGNNDFIFTNGSKLIKLLIRAIILIVILNLFQSSILLVLLDIVISIIFILIEIIWCYKKYSLKIKYKYFDKLLIFRSFKYTALMFLSSIINQINSNVDNVLIGSLVGAASVTVYSIGITIYGMFEQMSVSISGVLLPTVTNVLEEKDGLQKVQKLVIKVGQIQFILLGAIVIGFVILGKDFLTLWLGNGFEDAYIISIILMIPSIFTLCVNSMISILRAKNMLGVRTIIIFLSTCLNMIITYFGVKYYGYIAAAIGTALSLTFGIVIATNIYYYCKLKFNMIKIYYEIIKKIVFPLLISSVVLLIVHQYLNNNWINLIIKIIVFCVVYVILLYYLYLTKEDRKKIKSKIFSRKVKYEEN